MPPPSYALDATLWDEPTTGTGLYVRELTPIRPDLESAFLTLTADEGLGSEAHRDAGGLATGGAA